MTEFKPGDRVKVEYEATIERAAVRTGWFYLRIDGDPQPIAHGDWLSKLPDPEPEWRKGDVVRYRTWDDPRSPAHVAVRGGGAWSCSCGGEDFRDNTMRNFWQRGLVTVLHREDQP